jgi:uncharacterized cofD-like protein
LNQQPLRIVAIGGGTGLSTLLHGLKHRILNPPAEGARRGIEVTAVVTVTDDGGSSGRLRRDFSVLPPGDLRNCMVALSEDEALLSKLFQYRFPGGGPGLKNHSFGNLFVTALANLMGDFPRAIKVSSEILASVGRIFPSTSANVVLRATLVDGSTVRGETRISRSKQRIERIDLEPKRCRPLKETLQAIAEADLISLGPGSLFTSIVPNLLVEGIPSAIRRSPAVKACFVNLMSQPGETTDFSAADHIAMIHKHSRAKLLDVAIVNTAPISSTLKRRYAAQRAMPVDNDFDALAKLGVTVIGRDLLARSVKVRHNPDAMAAVALDLAAAGRRRRRANPES